MYARPIFYKAEFSNGRVLTRSSMGRVYTHAYLIEGTWTDEAKARWLKAMGPLHELTTWKHDGFSSSLELAQKACSPGYDAKSKVITFREISPVTVIARAEYREISNPTGNLAARAR